MCCNLGLDGVKTMIKLVERARCFAIGAHSAIGQDRKYTGEYYFYHCANVAAIVEGVPNVTQEMIAAAWLHDTVEDTAIEIGLIGMLFGDTVEQYVWDLTDSEQGNRKERKRLSRIRLGNVSAEVQTIKLADLIDNTSSIVEHDPEFAKVYMAEKRDVLQVLINGDRELWEYANDIVEDYFRVAK